MSITPRASVLWADTNTSMSYFPEEGADNGDDDLEQQLIPSPDDVYDGLHDGRTALDKTIDRIGMGSYQWTLLSLCGFGWMADNMWIQAVAIVLPRVQQHYSVRDSYIGLVSSSMFAGMMFGAIGWGTCSDLMGRSTAFNATLFFTSLFGLVASFATSFRVLCIILFFLGTAVGGSMPTDGTLLLEHMPKRKQYLVTALSVFFSFGSVLSAVVALLVVPQHSCSASIECDVKTQNQGWKYLLGTLGLITLAMFLARIVFFRLHESPRYLVHAGRHQEALESLQMISRFNGSDLAIDLEDVDDHRPVRPVDEPDEARVPFLDEAISDARKHDSAHDSTSVTVFDAGSGSESPRQSLVAQANLEEPSRIERPTLVMDYHSTGASASPLLESHSYKSPAEEYPPNLNSAESPAEIVVRTGYVNPTPFVSEFKETETPPVGPTTRPRPSTSRHSRQSSTTSVLDRRASSIYENQVCGKLPRFIRRPLQAWLDRVAMVLSPDWLRTTLLVWAAWCAMSLAYTMFNVFLPKLLETASDPKGLLPPKTLEDTLWDVVIFTVGGCPGAILGAYMIESPMGRRWALAGSTFITAFFCVIFAMVQSSWAIRASTVGISLSATTMWAVLYGWTPEIFGTKVRGTACGIASALSRIGGMIAPMLGGMLLMIDRTVPVYTSVVIFAIAGICVLMLKEDEGDGGRTRERVVVH